MINQQRIEIITAVAKRASNTTVNTKCYPPFFNATKVLDTTIKYGCAIISITTCILLLSLKGGLRSQVLLLLASYNVKLLYNF